MSNQNMVFLTPDAISDFRRARRRAFLEDIMAKLQRRSNSLLPYDEVRQKLHAQGQISRGLREIPIVAIVGSVGRYSDFTRSFLPRDNRDEERWAMAMQVTMKRDDIPPIEVYQIGSSYFVVDGNHRVSIARSMNTPQISAIVTEIETRVPFDPSKSPNEFIIKSELVEFLEHTQLDKLYPSADLSVTEPGQYNRLLDQICVMGLTINQEQNNIWLSEKAVRQWYETVYKPVVAIIRKNGMLHDFLNRTETDLYVWIAEHHAALEDELGWKIDSSTAATDLVRRRSPLPGRVLTRVREQLIDRIQPDLFTMGPPPGEWRQQRLAAAEGSQLFTDILVPINGKEAGWWALAQAIGVARHEGGRLAGLYVVPNERESRSESTQAIQFAFQQRCLDAGIEGKLAVVVGGAAQHICDRARWTDLVVVKLTYPPGHHPIKRFRSGFRALVQRCSRPILIVTDTPTQLHHVLLSYDGSPKSQEALYLATYMAQQWQISLTVVTIVNGIRTTQQTIERAQHYLSQHNVQASCQIEQGEIVDSILRVAEKQDCDLIVTGGYRHGPTREIVLGSKVDHLIQRSYLPLLICR